jgi:hypothetical protein
MPGVTIKETVIETHKTITNSKACVLAATLIAHIGIMCAGSILIHAILTARYVYWIHDLVWPVPWVQVSVEAGK